MVALKSAGVPDVSSGPLLMPMIALYVFGGLLVPLAMLITVAARRRSVRVPIVWLSGGLMLSFVAGA